MEKINGIIIAGKVYKVAESDVPNRDFSLCGLREKCGWLQGAMDICIEAIGLGNIFRFSQELTDKINEKLNKRTCPKDKSKVCDLSLNATLTYHNQRIKTDKI